MSHQLKGNPLPIRNTYAVFTATNPILLKNQIAIETDTGVQKIGDGTTAWSSLGFYENIQGVRQEYTPASGTDTYTASFLLESIDGYFIGLRLRVKFTNANTGASTINLNSFGAKTITKNVSSALTSGDILAGGIYELNYDGTNFQIQSAVGVSAGFITSVLDTATVDLNVAAGVLTANLLSVAGFGWSLLGNSGTTVGTNFIGTTDAKNLMFKTNSAQVGLLGNTNVLFGLGINASLNDNGNVAIGDNAMNASVTGGQNVVIGQYALYAANGASQNVALGYGALGSGGGAFFTNTAIGYYAGRGQTGNSNVSVGAYSGYYESGSNAFYLNNVDQTNTAGDKAYSLMYGTFAGAGGTTVGNTLTINGTVTAPTFIGALTGNATTSTTTTNIAGGTLGAIPYQSGVSTTAILAATATAGQMLRSGASAAPTWSTNTFPNTTAIGQILYATAANVIGGSTTLLTDGTYLIVGGTALIGTEIGSFQKNSNALTQLLVSNTTSGTAGKAGIGVVITGGVGVTMEALSAGYTLSGINIASTAVISTAMTVGMQIGTTSNTRLAFYTNNAEVGRFSATGEFIVNATSLIGTEIVSIQKNQNAITQLAISNTTSGTAGRSALSVYTNGTVGFTMSALSPAYTTSGMFVASTSTLHSTSLAGLNFGTFSATQVSIWTNNTKKVEISSVGNMSLGGVAVRSTTVGTFAFQIFDGTAPVGTLANGVSLFSVAGVLKSANAAGLVGFVNSSTDAAAAPATAAIGIILDYFGASATRVLTTPNSWELVTINGTVYKRPLYT